MLESDSRNMWPHETICSSLKIEFPMPSGPSNVWVQKDLYPESVQPPNANCITDGSPTKFSDKP